MDVEAQLAIYFQSGAVLHEKGERAESIMQAIDSAGQRGASWTTPIYINSAGMIEAFTETISIKHIERFEYTGRRKKEK